MKSNLDISGWRIMDLSFINHSYVTPRNSEFHPFSGFILAPVLLEKISFCRCQHFIIKDEKNKLEPKVPHYCRSCTTCMLSKIRF